MANDNNIQPVADDSQIVLYQPDESISLQVKIEEDTVWLTQAQMVELFGSSKANISEHITNIYQQGKQPLRKLWPAGTSSKRQQNLLPNHVHRI